MGRVRNAFPALPLYKTGDRYRLGAGTGIPIMGRMNYPNPGKTPFAARLGFQPEPKNLSILAPEILHSATLRSE